MKYNNPIIPGFAPDPSVTHVNGTFYLVTSSFHLFPGLPIYASKDLRTWTQIGNAINRVSQLDLSGATTNSKLLDTGETMIATAGLWAPTIRFHKGTFYLLCTNCIRRGSDFEKRNFYITCNDIFANNWSDPIYFDFDVIDPSIFFDDDDRAYIQGSFDLTSRKAGSEKTQPSCTIKQFEVDPTTGRALSSPQEIWPGWAKYDTEGPHLYKKDGWYFLLVAEGGTFEHHLLSIARSRSVSGPYESYEHNPILTADGKEEYIQNTGHGDIFQDNEGAWWAVVLGIRNENGRFPMGRETFLTAVTWPDNGWPEVAQPRLQFERNDITPLVTANYTGFQRSLLLEMVYIRVPVVEDYKISSDATIISIKANTIDISAFDGSPSFCGRRQTAIECSVVATLLLPTDRTNRSLRAGLTVFKDSFRHAEIFFDVETRNIIFRLVNKADKVREIVKISDIEIGWGITQIEFRIRATKRSYEFDFRVGGEEPWVELTVVDAIEMTARDFTGTVFGVFAHRNEEVNEDVIVEFVDFKQY